MASRARPRLVVAFDASSVSGARLAGVFGRPRLRGFVRIDLAPGVIVPSPTSPNVRDPEALGQALRALRRALGDVPPATLVLPDGVGRVVPLEVPPRTDPGGFVRFRLGPSLPFPAEEASFDALELGRGRILGAAVRRSVVGGYEEAAAGAGFSVDRVDLAPLVAMAGGPRRGPAVQVFLGDAALSIAAFGKSGLSAFRTRRRASGPGEAGWLVEEVERTARLAGSDGLLTLAGSGAAELVQELSSLGRPVRLAEPVSDSVGAADAAWLGGLLA